MKIWHLRFKDKYQYSDVNYFYREDKPPDTIEILELFHDWFGGEPILDPIEKYVDLKLVKVK